MFAEESIYGTTNATVDNKGRVCISKITNAEKDDKLLLIKVEDMFKVCREEDINKIIDKLNKMLLTETNEEKIVQINKKLYAIYEAVIRKCMVDSQGRINCGDTFEHNTTLKIIGARNSIYLQPEKKIK